MMRLAATSGIAPCSVAATRMSTSRSFLATVSSRPSPTSFRPSFQLVATRCAYEKMSSGRAVGTIRITICAPRSFSIAASLALSASACAGVSVAVWSMTRPVRTGTGTRSCACAGAKTNAASSSRRGKDSAHRALADQRDAGFSKLTAGGAEICASLATVKLGLVL